MLVLPHLSHRLANRLRHHRRAGVLAAVPLAVGLALTPVAQALGGDDPAPGAAAADQQVEPVLPGTREPGVPTLWRVHLGGADLTVSLGPSRPGTNLVRVDGATGTAVRVGVAAPAGQPGTTTRRLHPRPGTDGAWTVVDLPAGSSTLLVTHGHRRALLPVDTGTRPVDTSLWTGPQGPECLSAATAELLAAQDGSGACPAAVLREVDAASVRASVATLAARGVPALVVDGGTSPRGAAAARAARQEAARWGLSVAPSAPSAPGAALLVLSGWTEAARTVAAAPGLDAWVAPWSSPLDTTDPEAAAYTDRLAALLPGQAPTWSGYAAWLARRGATPDPATLPAAPAPRPAG